MLNSVVLMGRLTAEPELRHTPNGIAVTSFTLAVNRSYAKAGSERATDFIDIVAWRNTAEFVSRYFTKGQLVAVEGSIQTRTYQDKDGNNRKAFEIVANNVHFAEAKRDSASREVLIILLRKIRINSKVMLLLHLKMAVQTILERFLLMMICHFNLILN